MDWATSTSPLCLQAATEAPTAGVRETVTSAKTAANGRGVGQGRVRLVWVVARRICDAVYHAAPCRPLLANPRRSPPSS